MSGLKFIAMIFPFIREMILGEKTLLQALKTNKLKLFLLAAIMASFTINIFFIPKLVEISDRYVKLRDRTAGDQKELQSLREKNQQLEWRLTMKPAELTHPALPPSVPASAPAATSSPELGTGDPDSATDAAVQNGYTALQHKYRQATHPPKRPRGRPAIPDTHWKSDFDQIQSQENQYNQPAPYNH